MSVISRTRGRKCITSENYKVLYGDAIMGAVEAEAKISPGPLAGTGGSAGLDLCLLTPSRSLALRRRGRASGYLRYVSIRMTPDEPG